MIRISNGTRYALEVVAIATGVLAVLIALAAACTPAFAQGVRHRIAFEHATDCPANVTIAIKRQLCVDLDDGRIWRCEPAAIICTTSEWQPVAGEGFLAVVQTAHGFSVNQWLMHSDATNSWQLLDSTAVTTDHNAVGFVRSVEGPNDFTLGVAGSQSWTHGLDIGPLFASSTPGVVTDTAPVLGSIEWTVAIASSVGLIIIFQRDWNQL